jgi:C-terminal processing protease CtpA/Prc
MKYLFQLGLLLLLAVPSLAQPFNGHDPVDADIRERLRASDSLRSEGRTVEAIRLLESARRDERTAIDPTLRGRVQFELARAYAAAGKKEEAITALALASTLGDASYRMVERESDFDALRQDPRFIEILKDLADHQRPWERLWTAPAAFTSEEGRLSEDLKVAGLSLLWAEVKQNFVYFDRVPGLDWDSVYLAALPRVRSARNLVEYYRILQQICALLQDGHTEVDYPKSVRDSLLFRPAIDTRLVGQTVLVTGVHAAELASLGIAPGLEITSVDGTPVHDYVRASVAPYQSGSTVQDRNVRAYEFRLLSGSCSRPVTVGFRSATGETFTRKLQRTFSEEDLLWTRTPVESDTLVSNIGYLDLTTFFDEYMTRQVAQRIAQLKGTDALVIDMRENGGGFTDIAMQVLSLFMDSSFATHEWETPRYTPYARFEHGMLQWQRLPAGEWPGSAAAAYRKPIVLLTSPRTYSAAEHFLVSFRQAGRGTIIGEITGGSTGHALDLSLPGGGAVFINTTRDYYPDGRKFNGIGVVADVEVEPTVDDIRKGRDVVLATAIDYLQRKLGRSSGVPIVVDLEHRTIGVPNWMPLMRRQHRGAYSATDTIRPDR